MHFTKFIFRIIITKFNSVKKINAVIHYQNKSRNIWGIIKSFSANYEVV